MIPQTVAVVIPVHKQRLSASDTLSLSRCATVLADYPLVLAGPRSLDYTAYRQIVPSAQITMFDDPWFGSWNAHNRLMVSPLFYEAFRQFRFILKHELDAFVFQDQLLQWCERGWDYIGAPWHDWRGRWTAVGNSGFSLRHVSACLDVLRAKQESDGQSGREPPPGAPRRYRLWKGIFRRQQAEDLFWGLDAVRHKPSWRVAPVEEAMRFSVEAGLGKIAGLLQGRPPFGCHGRWYLATLHRYFYSDAEPEGDRERDLWELARLAGLERQAAAN